MRRLVPLLIAAMLCALATSGIAGGADATGTVAKKCSKRKKKRHHKRGRKHRKRRCGSATGSGAGSGGAQGGQAKCNDASAPGRIGAREKEYSIQPTMPSVACGTVLFEQRNEGMDAHDLILQKDGDAAPSYSFSALGPGGVAKQTVDLSRGTWTLYCDVAEPAPGHRALGMEVKLAVQ
jgi:hypothetical protein